MVITLAVLLSLRADAHERRDGAVPQEVLPMPAEVAVPDGAGRVVVGVDGSAHADAALRWAAREAGIHGLGVTAVLAWDYLDQRHPDGSREFVPSYGDADALADAALSTWRGRSVTPPAWRTAGSATVPARPCSRRPGIPCCSWSAHAGGALEGTVLGSTSQHVLHRATWSRWPSCPRTPCFDATRRVVVGVDGSEHALTVNLRWAGRSSRPGRDA